MLNNAIYTSIKNVKYLEINLAKDVQIVQTESYKTPLREIRDLSKRDKIYHVHGSEDSALLRCQFSLT